MDETQKDIVLTQNGLGTGEYESMAYALGYNEALKTMIKEDHSNKYDLKLTMMYSEYQLEFEECDFQVSEGAIIVSEQTKKGLKNTVIPTSSIAYYSVVQVEDKSTLVSIK